MSREIRTARFYGECRACYRRHIKKGDTIVSYGSGWAEIDCALNRHKRCPTCGSNNRMTVTKFFSKWLPARQHASDKETRAVVEASFPFEFRCYESWGVMLHVEFMLDDDCPQDLKTAADVLSGKKFGPFQCWCEADEEISDFFREATWGDSPSLANLPKHIREIVTQSKERP